MFKKHLAEIYPLAQSPNEFEYGKSMAYNEFLADRVIISNPETS